MVHRIGHVGIRVPDLERSVKHAEEILGLREVERVDGTLYLTCNERHHELVLIQDEEVACDHLAFEVRNEEDLQTAREALLKENDVTIVSEDPFRRWNHLSGVLVSTILGGQYPGIGLG